ncbi:MAG TPA: PaaI family thioesterase [Mycobacteriales bacterium]|nr:PaaI family thioesterase [Mycobacteriales bacterium]
MADNLLDAAPSDVMTEDERAAKYQDDWERMLHDPTGTPVHRQLGLKLLQLRPTTVLSMELSAGVRGFYPGSIHGGILATFADVASATALWNSHDRQTIPVTTDMHIRYYRQPKGGPLTAEVQVVHEGARLLSTECVVRDAQDRVLARTTGTFAIQPLRT